MSKLNYTEKNLIPLLARSPDIGDGWRKVSPVLFKHFSSRITPELFEFEQMEDGGGIMRLTERGKIVADYI